MTRRLDPTRTHGRFDFNYRKKHSLQPFKCRQGKGPHSLTLCLTTQTLWISWISEMQQEAVKHSGTRRAQNVSNMSTFYSLWCFKEFGWRKSSPVKVLHGGWCFFLSWMSTFSLYCCLAHTSAVTQPQKNTEKNGEMWA